MEQLESQHAITYSGALTTSGGATAASGESDDGLAGFLFPPNDRHSRVGIRVYNDSNTDLYIFFSSQHPTTKRFTRRIEGGASWDELRDRPEQMYQGAVSYRWASNATVGDQAMITEVIQEEPRGQHLPVFI